MRFSDHHDPRVGKCNLLDKWNKVWPSRNAVHTWKKSQKWAEKAVANRNIGCSTCAKIQPPYYVPFKTDVHVAITTPWTCQSSLKTRRRGHLEVLNLEVLSAVGAWTHKLPNVHPKLPSTPFVTSIVSMSAPTADHSPLRYSTTSHHTGADFEAGRVHARTTEQAEARVHGVQLLMYLTTFRQYIVTTCKRGSMM